MKKLEHLKRDVIEEGRAHPFVVSLLGELQGRYQGLHEALEAQAGGAAAGTEHAVYALGGRCIEVRNLIALITKTEGQAE